MSLEDDIARALHDLNQEWASEMYGGSRKFGGFTEWNGEFRKEARAILARQPAPSEGLRDSFDSTIEWPTTRRLFLEGKTVISQTPTDPGDIGEPRLHIEDDTTYVSVPEFELWPTDPDWGPHDASIVYITKRSFTLNAPGRMTYHRPSRHSRYSDRTGCGIDIWSSGWEPGQQSSLLAVRRDVASRIARPCHVCGVDR